MIHINLLQIKEELRRASIRNTIIAACLIWILSMMIVYIWHAGLTGEIDRVQQSTQQLRREITKVKSIIGEVEKIKEQKADLEKKIHTIQLLDADRKLSVIVLNELERISSKELWFTRIVTTGKHIKLEGRSVDNQIIGGFFTRLDESPYFTSLEYGPSKQEKGEGGMLVFGFTVDANIVEPKAETYVSDEELAEARQ